MFFFVTFGLFFGGSWLACLFVCWGRRGGETRGHGTEGGDGGEENEADTLGFAFLRPSPSLVVLGTGEMMRASVYV